MTGMGCDGLPHLGKDKDSALPCGVTCLTVQLIACITWLKKCGGGASEQGRWPLCLLLAAGAMATCKRASSYALTWYKSSPLALPSTLHLQLKQSPHQTNYTQLFTHSPNQLTHPNHQHAFLHHCHRCHRRRRCQRPGRLHHLPDHLCCRRRPF